MGDSSMSTRTVRVRAFQLAPVSVLSGGAKCGAGRCLSGPVSRRSRISQEIRDETQGSGRAFLERWAPPPKVMASAARRRRLSNASSDNSRSSLSSNSLSYSPRLASEPGALLATGWICAKKSARSRQSSRSMLRRSPGPLPQKWAASMSASASSAATWEGAVGSSGGRVADSNAGPPWRPPQLELPRGAAEATCPRSLQGTTPALEPFVEQLPQAPLFRPLRYRLSDPLLFLAAFDPQLSPSKSSRRHVEVFDRPTK